MTTSSAPAAPSTPREHVPAVSDGDGPSELAAKQAAIVRELFGIYTERAARREKELARHLARWVDAPGAGPV